MIRLIMGSLLASLLPLSLAAVEPDPAEPVQFSEAETRMWMTDQLRTIPQPMTLHYDFHKTGTFEEGFTDQVEFTVNKVNVDGSKSASLEFFTGERRLPVPPVESTTVNPVLKAYMQGDVYEMSRLTDPNGTARERWRYFQRRIKFALAEAAVVKPTTFEFDGRTWQGFEISFTPFLNDPKRELFARFARKRYSVVVSDELPGYLYRIESVIPGENDAAAPLIQEVLQLAVIKPAG